MTVLRSRHSEMKVSGPVMSSFTSFRLALKYSDAVLAVSSPLNLSMMFWNSLTSSPTPWHCKQKSTRTVVIS